MSQQASQQVTIVNPHGLHARPADLLVRMAGRFKSNVSIVKGHERVDGKSILSVLTLAAQAGTQLTIETDGPDAQQALRAIVTLVESGFSDMEESESKAI